jgi:predicted cupin superfamily sugar epimerase
MEIDNEGRVKHTILGSDVNAGQALQHVVPPLVWFGAYPTYDVASVSDDGQTIVRSEGTKDPEHNFSLVGCTVAPAFQFEDSEMAKRSVLSSLFPHAKDCVEFLTDADE